MKLPRRYPRSFLRLILFGYGVVLLPLLFAAGYGLLSVEHLTLDAEASMRDLIRVERYRRQASDQMRSMERFLRQYQVLGDKGLLDDFLEVRNSWRSTTRDFMALETVAPQADRFARLLNAEEAAFVVQQNNPAGDRGATELADAVSGLRSELDLELRRLDDLVGGAVAHFRLDAEEMELRLAAVVALALPFSLVIVTFFRSALSQLFGSFEKAIAQLGGGRLDEPIALEGTADIRAMGERLDWLRRRLVDLESERSRFLRSVSHELKTPLASLREGTQLLADGVAGDLSAQQRTVTQIMGSSVLRLQGLIDDMLRLQRTVYESRRIQPEPVELAALLREVITAHLLSARQRNVRFVEQIESVTVEGGLESLRLALGNLVSNAVKYSPDGGEITVSLCEEQGRACIEVLDQGPGIPVAERDRIFEAFFRAKQNGSVEGNGLGLAIAMECVSAHRGSIDLLDSDRGARFRVVIPQRWGTA